MVSRPAPTRLVRRAKPVTDLSGSHQGAPLYRAHATPPPTQSDPGEVLAPAAHQIPGRGPYVVGDGAYVGGPYPWCAA